MSVYNQPITLLFELTTIDNRGHNNLDTHILSPNIYKLPSQSLLKTLKYRKPMWKLTYR